MGRFWQTVVMTLFLLFTGVLTGCGTELENKSFPLALGIDRNEEGVQISFGFPKLKEVADTGTDIQNAVFAAKTGENWYQAWSSYEEESYQEPDYKHMKVIVFGKDFFEDKESLKNLLEFLREEDKLPGNTLVFATEGKAAKLLTLGEKLETPVGSYLEEMAEQKKEYSQSMKVSLQTLYNACHNENDTFLIPIVSEKDGGIEETGYLFVDGLEGTLELTAKEAEYVFLARGDLKSMEEELGNGQTVELKGIRTEVKIEENTGMQENESAVKITPVLKVKLSAEVFITGAGGDEEEIAARTEKIFCNRLLELWELKRDEGCVDFTGSYQKLGGLNRKLYNSYYDDRKQYEEDLVTEFEAEFAVVTR